VSREYEKKLFRYYGIDLYWPYAYTAPGGASIFYPPRPMNIPNKAVEEEDLDTNLRSFNEVRGYHIQALDGKIGHVEDIIVDDGDWQVVYLVIDTKNWVPWSKNVILSIDWLDKVSFINREVFVNLHSETIQKAPEIKHSHPIEMEYERALYEYYTDLFKDR
jgi:hypothetical protein